MATGEVAMAYAPGAVERAMKVQEVIVQAIAGKLTWIQAAEILGCSARTLRRYRWRLERDGYDGLFDRRRRLPSPKRAPLAELQRVLALYRDRYRDFNVRHFHQLARREHGVRFCYAFVKKALQSAGLVPKHRPRGRHRADSAGLNANWSIQFGADSIQIVSTTVRAGVLASGQEMQVTRSLRARIATPIQ